jgi:hypothetical protein
VTDIVGESVNLCYYLISFQKKMVRYYQRKTQRASQYTKEILNNAVEEIRRGALTIYRAHKLFNIPKTTLFYHLNGSRGNKSNT